MDKLSDVEHIKQYDGFGLYDATFVEQLRSIKDPLPYLRGLVAEVGPERATVEYTQETRKAGRRSAGRRSERLTTTFATGPGRAAIWPGELPLITSPCVRMEKQLLIQQPECTVL